jgi:hypothetical protein
MLESIGILALIIAVYFIYENHSQNQDIDREEERVFLNNSEVYRALKRDFQSGKINQYEFEKQKKEILNNNDERKKVAQMIKERATDELERKEEFKRMRIVGYKYDEFIFKIFNDCHELTWDELLNGVQKSFNLPTLDWKARDEYHKDEMPAPDEEIVNIWLDNKLVEIYDWSLLIEQNRFNIEYFKIGEILRYKHHKINTYDITYDEWLEDRNITLKHNKYYDLYLMQNKGVL